MHSSKEKEIRKLLHSSKFNPTSLLFTNFTSLNIVFLIAAMQSHHKFNEHKMVESVVNRIKGGETVALISDAGTPGISDPGFLVVRECIKNDIEVQCLPGATAFVPAVVSSGLPNERFCFEGFLPQKKGRMTRLKSLQSETRTMIFYESPHRLLKTLTQFGEYFGIERKASVSREISKLHEYYALKTNYLSAEKTGFPFGGLYELAAASTLTDGTSYEDNYSIDSYLSRLNYNYKEKYYLSGSFRTDGSSRFYKDQRWGTFWSVGASWTHSSYGQVYVSGTGTYANNVITVALKHYVSAGSFGTFTEKLTIPAN